MQPIYFTWLEVDVVGRDGEITRTRGMFPFKRQMNVASAQFEDGGQYQLEVVAAKGERSDRSHRHYMATVTEAWRNLPEDMAKEYPSPDHLRKRALIKCGYYHRDTLVFDTDRDAVRAAAYIKPMDEFSVVTVQKNVVTRYRAKSQKYLRAGGMAKEEFQKSKDDVLALLASKEILNVKKAELAAAGEKSDV